jgi:hypothetical protein
MLYSDYGLVCPVLVGRRKVASCTFGDSQITEKSCVNSMYSGVVTLDGRIPDVLVPYRLIVGVTWIASLPYHTSVQSYRITNLWSNSFLPIPYTNQPLKRIVISRRRVTIIVLFNAHVSGAPNKRVLYEFADSEHCKHDNYDDCKCKRDACGHRARPFLRRQPFRVSTAR